MSGLKKGRVQSILGSTRDGRFDDRGAANCFCDLAAKREDLMVDLITLRNWPLPFFEAEAAKLPTTNADKEYSDV